VRLNFIRPGDVENALAWARDTLNAGDTDSAEDALATLKPEDRATVPATTTQRRESRWREGIP